MQYKICRNCGYQNGYMDDVCSKCGGDITLPSYYDIESDGVEVEYAENGEAVLRLWSSGLSKLLAVIMTIITLTITVFLLNKYFGITIREGMYHSAIVRAIGNKVGYDISELLEEETASDKKVESQENEEKKNKVSKKKKKNNSYVLKNSSKQYISMSKLKNLSKRKLAIARNEIFARNGYTFKDGKWKKYFLKKSWYKPKYSTDYFNKNYEKILNKYEKKNIKRIVRAEKMKEG